MSKNTYYCSAGNLRAKANPVTMMMMIIMMMIIIIIIIFINCNWVITR